ncbi:MAG: TIGR01841 family phasin [Rhodospirillales bacterium]
MKTETTNQAQPFGDVTAMMAQFKMPGIDMAAIVEARRKDIQALVDANTASFESMQALAKKQTEMLSQAMQGMQEAAKSAVGTNGAADVAKQGEVIRKGFEKTLANMKELADMAKHAQSEAMARITQRASHQMQEIKALVTPK